MSGLLDLLRKKMNAQPSQDVPASPPRPKDHQNEEDPWSDVTSSAGEPSPTSGIQNVDGGLDTYESLEKDTAHFLPYMPSLLGKDLPPCGLNPQVAYENVNARLRKRWIYFRGKKTASDVCQVVKDDLDNQNFLFPAFSVPSAIGRSKQQRTPWRREAVFSYEVRWIDYFLREAQAMEPMTESELIAHAEQPSIPKELGLRCDEKDVLALWDAWHAKKRAPSPLVPGVDTGSNNGAGSGQVSEIPIRLKNPVASGLLGETAVVDEDEETEEGVQKELRGRANSWATVDQD